MRQAVANDGLRDREGERRGLREGMPTDRKADIKLPRRKASTGGEKDCHLHIINGRVPWQQAAGDR